MKYKTIPKHHKKRLEHIGLIVKTYRELELLNQNEIKCLHYNSVSNLENSKKSNITILNLLNLCDELEIPLDLLFEDNKDI